MSSEDTTEDDFSDVEIEEIGSVVNEKIDDLEEEFFKDTTNEEILDWLMQECPLVYNQIEQSKDQVARLKRIVELELLVYGEINSPQTELVTESHIIEDPDYLSETWYNTGNGITKKMYLLIRECCVLKNEIYYYGYEQEIFLKKDGKWFKTNSTELINEAIRLTNQRIQLLNSTMKVKLGIYEVIKHDDLHSSFWRFYRKKLLDYTKDKPMINDAPTLIKSEKVLTPSILSKLNTSNSKINLTRPTSLIKRGVSGVGILDLGI